MHFIGLTKLSQDKPIKEMTRFEKWVYLLYNSNKYASKDSIIPYEIESEAGITEVVDCVKKSNSDKEMRARMEDRENSLIALSIMRGNSYQKGKEDGIKEIIRNMLLKGKSKVEIIDLIGITDEEYEKSIE